ncbi:MAG: magnesium transporter [Micavibrio sp.]|nr:magnesium transporter [Micavibrio sp.]|tara:strand:+ start:4645 stop:6051 length:1407 start_codon:yes stop_codon:yes gene_type:complete
MSDNQIQEKESSSNDNDVDENPFRLNDVEIRGAVEAVRAQDSDTVHALIDDLSPADVAELIEKVGDEDRREFVGMFSDKFDPQTFSELNHELRRQTLSAMSAEDVAGIITELDSDDALDIIEDLDDEFQQDIIRKLSAKTRLAVQEGLNFPEDSAGRLMQREVVAVPEFWTAGKTIDYLRNAGDTLPDDFFDIIVVSPSYHVTGEIPLRRLVCAKRSEKLDHLKLDDAHPIPAEMDQEEVADIFRRDNILSAPVVDENGRLLGVITIDDVIDVIDEEAQEDFLKLAGVENSDLYHAILSTTGTRFRWLFVNLLTAILASIVISLFDATIEQIVALAVLMPIVASMGGNAGTQALTVAVRALATRELTETNAWRIIGKETAVGTLNGIMFAVMAGLATSLWFGSPMLGAVIAMAMIINLVVAGLFGAGIPIILQRIGADPAVASAVVLTTITDVVGFFAFLGLAAALLL